MLKISTHQWKQLAFPNDTPITWLVVRYTSIKKEAAQVIFLAVNIYIFGLKTSGRNKLLFDRNVHLNILCHLVSRYVASRDITIIISIKDYNCI